MQEFNKERDLEVVLDAAFKHDGQQYVERLYKMKEA